MRNPCYFVLFLCWYITTPPISETNPIVPDVSFLCTAVHVILSTVFLVSSFAFYFLVMPMDRSETSRTSLIKREYSTELRSAANWHAWRSKILLVQRWIRSFSSILISRDPPSCLLSNIGSWLCMTRTGAGRGHEKD